MAAFGENDEIDWACSAGSVDENFIELGGRDTVSLEN
jgi:hypothetical protein